MWIRCGNYGWINMNHITHFTIQQDSGHPFHRHLYHVYAHLSIGITKLSPDNRMFGGDPPTPYASTYEIPVFTGTAEACETYVKERTFVQQGYYWLSHLAAGLIGGLITLLIKTN